MLVGQARAWVIKAETLIVVVYHVGIKVLSHPGPA